MVRLSASRQFLTFWVTLILGLAVGQHFSFSLFTLGFLTSLWALIYFSGQDANLELLALCLFGLGLGVLLWQATAGESWLKLAWLSALSDKLIQFRDFIVDRFFLSLPEPHGSLLAGIIFGNRLKLDQELINQFRTVGISHIIAVSGYNLSILTANALSLFRPLWGKSAGYAALILIVVFVLISGAPASILRAAVMATLVIVASFVGRPVRPINLIIITAGFLAIFEPKIVFEVGFQLSVAATYGVMRLSPLISFAFKNWRFPDSLKSIMSETLAAIVLTAPILIYYFGQLSLISPLSNLLTLPLVPTLMAFGLLATVGVVISAKLGALLVLLNWPILQWIIFISDKLSQLSWALIKLELPFWLFAVTLMAILAATEFLAPKSEQLEHKDLLFVGDRLGIASS